MLEIAQKLNLSQNLIEELSKLDKIKIEKLADKCTEQGFHNLKKASDITRLAAILILAVRVKEKYDRAGIDEKIYYDTMSDIRIWCEHNQNNGLKNYNWLKNHVSFELFRLGRLQFQLYPCKNKTLMYQRLPFDYGENLIYIHIPEGEKLEKEKCINSLEAARQFFPKFFPQYDYRYFFCESWLLFEGNINFMAQESNIINFMSLFDICYSVKIDVQAIERIFGKRRLLKSSYPEKTDLQRRAKKYMQSGERLGVGIGVIEK